MELGLGRYLVLQPRARRVQQLHLPRVHRGRTLQAGDVSLPQLSLGSPLGTRLLLFRACEALRQRAIEDEAHDSQRGQQSAAGVGRLHLPVHRHGVRHHRGQHHRQLWRPRRQGLLQRPDRPRQQARRHGSACPRRPLLGQSALQSHERQEPLAEGSTAQQRRHRRGAAGGHGPVARL